MSEKTLPGPNMNRQKHYLKNISFTQRYSIAKFEVRERFSETVFACLHIWGPGRVFWPNKKFVENLMTTVPLNTYTQLGFFMSRTDVTKRRSRPALRSRKRSVPAFSECIEPVPKLKGVSGCWFGCSSNQKVRKNTLNLANLKQNSFSRPFSFSFAIFLFVTFCCFRKLL